jgi:CheY-like chemotaxis protein
MKAKTHFLLVEDNPNDILLLRTAFQDTVDSTLQVVEDGEQAVAYLTGQAPYSNREQYPLPQVILLDLKMPRLSGFEFLHWLRSEASDSLRLLPVIIMSSSNLPEDINRAYALGVNTYMVKPVDWALLRQRLSALNSYWGVHAETPTLSQQ